MHSFRNVAGSVIFSGLWQFGGSVLRKGMRFRSCGRERMNSGLSFEFFEILSIGLTVGRVAMADGVAFAQVRKAH